MLGLVREAAEIDEAHAGQTVEALFDRTPFYAESGGLISYGINQLEQARPAASYVDQILRGANPGDLPVQLPLKYELVVNLKTAAALGLTVPNSLQLLADQVIE